MNHCRLIYSVRQINFFWCLFRTRKRHERELRRTPRRLRRLHDRLQLPDLPDAQKRIDGWRKQSCVKVFGRTLRSSGLGWRVHRQQGLPGLQSNSVANYKKQLCKELDVPRRKNCEIETVLILNFQSLTDPVQNELCVLMFFQHCSLCDAKYKAENNVDAISFAYFFINMPLLH